MKTALNILIAGLALLSLPFTIFSSWLLYQHVQATELMWFLWWLVTPLTVCIALLSAIAKHYLDKEK